MVYKLLKKIYDAIAGTRGIEVFPAAAVPANNVSMAEVARQIYNEVAALDGAAMRGTDSAALASAWTSALATILGNFTALRIGDLDELAAANIPADIDGLVADIIVIDGLLDAIGVDSALTTTLQASVGNKGDTAVQATTGITSLLGYMKGFIDMYTDVVTTWPAGAIPSDGVGFLSGVRRIYDEIMAVNALHQVAPIDSGLSNQIRYPIGNKADTAAVSILNTNSLMRYMKGLLGAGWTNESLKATYDAVVAGGGLSPTGAGVQQTKAFSITAALNAGITVVATVTTQPVVIDSIVLHADTAAHADMTTCAIEGGVGQVVEFIGVTDAIEANLDAADKQVYWTGAVRFAVGKIIYIDLQGVGVNAADLTVTITYHAEVSGGVLA